MFLVRTTRQARGTSSAVTALAYAEEMRDAGERVTVTSLSGRLLTAADLRREIEAVGAITITGNRMSNASGALRSPRMSAY